MFASLSPLITRTEVLYLWLADHILHSCCSQCMLIFIVLAHDPVLSFDINQKGEKKTGSGVEHEPFILHMLRENLFSDLY